MSTEAAGPLISLEDITFRYRAREEPVLVGMSHAFMPGSMTGVTGPSGCGKSTLLALLGLLLTPDAGRICWSGEDLGRGSDAVRSDIRARRVGFVFQDALLDPARTILANVVEGGLYAAVQPADLEARALDLLERFGVEQRADHRPGEISGGQAQRVALCRALVKDPALLLADEPSGNLDDASATVVWEALWDAASAGAAVVVATHDTRWISGTAELIRL
jgi:lipoprotein-releasing system ATP-binding protein